MTVFLTGYSAAGKTTIAEALRSRLVDAGEDRHVSILDGDILRNEISRDLGFSRDDREEQLRRVGVIASQITSRGGIVICALIAPYQTSRDDIRDLVGKYGDYVEVYVSTPLEVCETRDKKGLYKKARLGEITEFTGISAPYEIPLSPEIIVDSTCLPPSGIVELIMHYLADHGFVRDWRKEGAL
jgi:sulfate adenylyltransferase